jgi:hypothetical protein
LPGAGFFPFADFAAPFLPNQLLLMSLSALNPKRRIQLAATFVFASGLGAFRGFRSDRQSFSGKCLKYNRSRNNGIRTVENSK